MKAMILAAGLGTRLRPITNLYAKPAVPFLNVPMLYFSFELLAYAGVTELVINSHHHAEQIAALAKDAPGLMTAPIITHEAGEPLGSGGGLWHAREHFDGPATGASENFWLANGDEVILPRNLNIFDQLSKQHHRSGAIATILVMKHPLVGTQFGGVWADSRGRVRGFGKTGAAFGDDATGYHYIGLQILNRRIFGHLPAGESNILYDALNSAIAAGEKVEILCSEFTWFETGNPKDFVNASMTCMRLLADRARSNGDDRKFLLQVLARFSKNVEGEDVIWHHPSSRIDAPNALVLAAQGVRVAAGANLSGHLVLGQNSSIEEGSRVLDCVLLKNAVVPKGADVHHSIEMPPSTPLP